MSDVGVKTLLKANKILAQHVLESENFSDDDKELFSQKLGELMTQVNFWSDQNNNERLEYELMGHIKWTFATYPPTMSYTQFLNVFFKK
tara:strand:+ start:1552 stop:1818 length:267 start_codon:yes stop_codon:yes gene_type:complete